MNDINQRIKNVEQALQSIAENKIDGKYC